MSVSQQMWDNLGQQQHAYYLELRRERWEWLRSARAFLWDKWGGRCAFCPRELGHYGMTIDHICPKSRGGTDETYNLRPLCRKCHGELNQYNQCIGALLLSRGEGAPG